MKNILIVSGHTDLKDSVANKTILEELEEELFFDSIQKTAGKLFGEPNNSASRKETFLQLANLLGQKQQR